MRLKGKTAIVTGAGRGIGQAIALAFAREGACVAVADIDPRTAQATARRIGRPPKGLALMMDVADLASVRAGFAAIDALWGRIDIAVTNAAIEPIAPFLELSEASRHRIEVGPLCGPRAACLVGLRRREIVEVELLQQLADQRRGRRRRRAAEGDDPNKSGGGHHYDADDSDQKALCHDLGLRLIGVR